MHVMRTVFLILVAGFLPFISSAQHGSPGRIDETARANWIRDAADFLLRAKPGDFANKIEFYESNRGYDAVLAFTVEQNGYVELDENEWVCIVTHSAHDNPRLGDIVLAVDHLGNLFEIDTHICGGIAFFLGYDMFMPANTTEFFAKFKGNKVNCFWREYPPSELRALLNRPDVSAPVGHHSSTADTATSQVDALNQHLASLAIQP